MARVPFGYKQEGDAWLIDEQAAAVVQRIFDEFTRPYFHTGLSEIAEGLNVDGIPTQRSGRWHASTVRYILANVFYVGGDKPAIISLVMYDQAQSRLAAMKMGPTR